MSRIEWKSGAIPSSPAFGKDILRILYHIFSMEMFLSHGCALELPAELIKDTNGQDSLLEILGLALTFWDM